MHDTIQWQNCVLHLLNMKINWKLVDKSNAQFLSSLKWEHVYEKVPSWAVTSILPHVIVEVDHTNKLTQLFASFWNCEDLNGLDFLWYGHYYGTSDVITQIVKFVGAKALFSGVELEPSLLEAGEHLFEESNMFCPRAFCNMKKVVNVNTHCF